MVPSTLKPSSEMPPAEQHSDNAAIKIHRRIPGAARLEGARPRAYGAPSAARPCLYPQRPAPSAPPTLKPGIPQFDYDYDNRFADNDNEGFR